MVGSAVGSGLGSIDGCAVGSGLGCALGRGVGTGLGWPVGAGLGWAEGAGVGRLIFSRVNSVGRWNSRVSALASKSAWTGGAWETASL